MDGWGMYGCMDVRMMKHENLLGSKKYIYSEAKYAALSLPRLDGENEDERDTESDGQPDGDRNKLQGDLKPGQVRCG